MLDVMFNGQALGGFMMVAVERWRRFLSVKSWSLLERPQRTAVTWLAVDHGGAW